MPSSTMQIFAFVLALLGVLGATTATLLPNWKVSISMGSNIMSAISQMQGLWMDCTWYSSGVFSCTLKYSVLALPAYLQTARTTMVLSCLLATLGLWLAALGLKCTHWGGSQSSKVQTAISAGACFVLAGVLCLVPASWFTNEVINTFMDSKVPPSGKYEPGGAVYVAFVSAGFFLAGGVIFCLSCPRKRDVATNCGSSNNDKQQKQERREQQSQTEPSMQDQEQHHKENPAQEKLKLEQEQQCNSPSRKCPQSAKVHYSLQDYV
ncbi:claudin-20 [Trichomycterus rosablanca]|uniref:claudin-20 n=1 Tax=Trichomycterus rosablanca TaxID=2290929 RepID=UPI002F352A9B